MTIVDFHNHYYPPEYLRELQREPSAITVTTDRDGNPVLHSPGDENIVVPGHRDVAARLQVLDEHEVQMQVLTLTAPGTVIETPARSVALAHIVNDALTRVVQERPTRFTALGTLPLNDPPAAVREFDRVRQDLGLKGVMLFGNVNGTPLWDERFWPLFERASDTQSVIYIHPTYPLGVEAMTRYWLMPLVGFLFDTTLAAAGLVFSGVVERFPDIRWVLGHLGGTIPYLAERLDRGYEAFTECRKEIRKPPSVYLRDFYYDTVNFDIRALELALGFVGAGHLVAGSDYPHQIGSLRKMIDSISRLQVSSADRTLILGENAKSLLGIGSQ
jgi:aminocarboxymuconate-semialdehyde decarboxylase